MSDKKVIFKGTVNGLTIIMNEEDSFNEILNKIDKKLSSAGKFFKGANICVGYRGRNLSEEEESIIYGILSEKSGAEIQRFEKEAEKPDNVSNNVQRQTKKNNEIRNYFYTGIKEGMAKFIKGTVRSGQLINYNGNVVVIGDVNPGGEIIATGNIIVLGLLRGIVHAGSDGNREAFIVSLNLQPTQLRIADVITRSPDEKRSKSEILPELACIKDDMVYIESLMLQHK